jgi:hypothetical protein
MTVKEFLAQFETYLTQANVPENAIIQFYYNCESCGHGGHRDFDDFEYSKQFNRLTVDIKESY